MYGTVGMDLFLGTRLASSGPLLQKSHSEIFPREISDPGTRASLPEVPKCYISWGVSLILGL